MQTPLSSIYSSAASAVVESKLLACILCASLIYAVNWAYSSVRFTLPLPPSPRGLPIVGHLFQLQDTDQWVVYHEWCKSLGSKIIRVHLPGQLLIILDTYEDCIELLEKRSAIYSGRMKLVMVNELMGWGFNIAWMTYGNLWRDLRRLMHDSFNPVSVQSFQSLQLQSARELLPALQHTTDILAEFRQLSGKIIMDVTYGLKVKPKNDPFIEAAENGVSALLEAAIPGKYLVDSFPALRQGRKWRANTELMVEKPYAAFKKDLHDGTAGPSFSHGAVQVAASKGSAPGIYTEENIKAVAGTMYQTGSDTTRNGLGFVVLMLLDRPDIVKKIQAEIDAVTGGTRLPEFEDEDLLPYLKATIKETLRYWSTVPLAVPHVSNEEDEYKGYRLPRDSIVVPNSWAILHNEDVFPDPFKFIPERYIDNKNADEVEAHWDVGVWGFGRRVCPGRYLAWNSVWITIAHILAIYDVDKARDKNGNVMEPSTYVVPSILLAPPDYRCKFTYRSREAEELLMEALHN